MSDVVVTVVESNTNVTVTEQDVAVAVTETSVDVSTSTAGIQGATGATGAGYSGVTSVSTITIGSGLKTFTLVSGNQGAFLTGMRVRAIHSDTPTYYMEGTANYIGAGTLIITVDKFNGSGSHNLWQFAVAGEVGQTGATGASGVVSVTSPITNTGTSGSAIVGIDLTNIAQRNTANAFTVGGHVITNASAGVIPLIVKGASGQSANMLEIQSSVGTVLARFASTGQLLAPSIVGTAFQITSGGVFSNGSTSAPASTQAYFLTTSATNVGAVIRGAASQTANLQEWQNSAGSLVANMSPAGTLVLYGSGITSGDHRVGTATYYSASLNVSARSATEIGAVVRGFTSQSANLQEWQNSAGTVRAKVDSSGNIFGQVIAGINSLVFLREESSGGLLEVKKLTAAASNPGANNVKLYVRDGTTAGTLKLVVRAGAAGAETTILDNIPQ
jgi:hypothetical protein